MDKEDTSTTGTATATGECVELKNIQYKSMLLSGNFNTLKEQHVQSHDASAIDALLEHEKHASKSEPWSKLDKTTKVAKLREYADRYISENDATLTTTTTTPTDREKDKEALIAFLLTTLDQKKLLKTKEVNYDKSSGCIKSIPCLGYNVLQKKFTLKRCEKRQSTLKSLAPITTPAAKKPKKNALLSPDAAAAAAATSADATAV